MSALYGLVGEHSKDWLSYGGRVIVHHNRAEMAFLFPNTRIEKITSDPGPTMRLQDHPGLTAVLWPLNRNTFK